MKRETRYTLQKTIRYALVSLAAFIMVFPFIWMVMNSFNSKESIMEIPPNLMPDKFLKQDMFSNYEMVFTNYNFGRYLWNSLIVAGLASIGQLVTCSSAGFAIGKMRFRGRVFVFGLILGTMMLPIHATIIPEYILMNNLGWIDTFAPLIIPSFLVGSFGTFLFAVFFENAPNSLLEAAVIDGAGPFQAFGRIFLPLARGALITLFIIAFMNNWNQLLRPVLYISSDEMMTSTLALTRFQSQYSSDWSLLLTGAVVSTAPLLLLYAFLQRYVIEGVSRMGIKG